MEAIRDMQRETSEKFPGEMSDKKLEDWLFHLASVAEETPQPEHWLVFGFDEEKLLSSPF